VLLIRGKIESGLKEATDFMAKEVYKKQYKRKLGFVPVCGTLNVKLENNIRIDFENQLVTKLKEIKGEGNLGDVFFLDAIISTVDNKISKKGAILFPVKTCYDKDVLEFVSDEKLRDTMDLEDGMEVILEIND
jgi:riboflavin kinase